MKPLETTQFDLQFAVPLSPWWLLLLLPMAGLAAYGLYRRQLKGVSHQNSVGLIALRVILFCGLVFVAFRPSFILRKILTFPGRVVFLIDDSASMEARDNSMSDAAALWLNRKLGGEREQGDAYHSLADQLSNVESEVRRFERKQAGADRGEDAFWDMAEQAQTRMLEAFETFETKVSSAPAIPDAIKGRFNEVVAEVKELKSGQATFFSGDVAPDKSAFDAFAHQLQSTRTKLYEIQAAFDDAAIAAGNESLKSRAGEARRMERLELCRTSIADSVGRLKKQLPNQYFRQSTVMTMDVAALEKVKVEKQSGDTNILGRLETILNEESDFPLTSVVVFSDGRDLSGREAGVIQKAYSRKQVPIFTAGAGHEKEPFDVAVLKVVSPPFAVKESPIRSVVTLKSHLPEEVEAEVQIRVKGNAVSTQKVLLPAGESLLRAEIPVTLKETGMYRCQVLVQPVKGEVFPVENNSSEFAVNVREKQVKVLFLDWKPRWESRFALNILQRMDFIDLNSIIAVVQENAEVKRGARRGAWPDNLDAMEMYDLIVLGELPDDLLTESEWADLKTLVWEKGKSLCIIGNGESNSVPENMAEALLPVKPSSPATALPESREDLSMLPPGLYHPVSYLLADALKLATTTDVQDATAGSDLRPDTQALVTDIARRTVISSRYTGNGKLLFINSERLWKLLNPTHLQAHAQIYIGLVSWAIEGQIGPEDSVQQLGLDRLNLTDANRLQVWAKGVSSDATIDALSGGEVLASAVVSRDKGSDLGRATFEDLPASDVTFRLRDTEVVTPATVVIQSSDELKYLALNEPFLRTLAQSTGGEYRHFTEFEDFMLRIEPKERIEKQERVWRLWDAAGVLAFLVVIVTIEWVWRKFVGLV